MSPAEAARQVEIEVDAMVLDVDQKAIGRGVRGVNLLRSAALEVLGQDGTGRQYRNGHVASAPGQPPAPDTGNLRKNWRQKVSAAPNGIGLGVRIKMQITGDTFYAKFLEAGTSKMAARPFHDRIKNKARPKITALFSDL